MGRRERKAVVNLGTGLIVLFLACLAVMGAAQGNRTMVGAARGASPVATPRSSPVQVATPAARIVSVAGSVTIELTDGGFSPSTVQATNGHDLVVTLVNTGSRRHAFQIARLKVNVSLTPGERRTIIIKTPPLGEFTYTSDAPGDEHITGTLVFYI